MCGLPGVGICARSSRREACQKVADVARGGHVRQPASLDTAAARLAIRGHGRAAPLVDALAVDRGRARTGDTCCVRTSRPGAPYPSNSSEPPDRYPRWDRRRAGGTKRPRTMWPKTKKASVSEGSVDTSEACLLVRTLGFEPRTPTV